MSDQNERDVAELMTRRAEQVSKQIQPMLAGLGPYIQGAILADLVSLWVAGHIHQDELLLPQDGDRPLTDQARAEVFDEWIGMVRKLVPASEQEIRTRPDDGTEGHA